jgi:hypothetical protein
VLLGGGAHHAGEDLPDLGACPGAVAALAVAGDHGGADGLLGAPVGRLHTGQPQEREQVLALGGEVVEQPPVGRVAGGPGHQLVELRAEAVCLAGEGGPIQGARVVGVAEGERVQQDAAYRVRGAGCPRSASASSSRQRRSRCARQRWWRAWANRRYGAQPSRSSTPASPSPRTWAASW